MRKSNKILVMPRYHNLCRTKTSLALNESATLLQQQQQQQQ